MNGLENKRILVVEDEELSRVNLERILRKEGYEVIGVENGLKAIELLKEEKVDVILTDLKMELADGMKVLEVTKEFQPEAQVIIITGYATVESAVKAMKQGAYYYIAKPFRLDVIREIVKEALLRKIVMTESHTS